MDRQAQQGGGGGWRGYAVAAVTVGVAAIATAMSQTLRDRGAFVLFIAAVAVTAWRGGFRPALLAIAISGAVGAFFVLAPSNSFVVAEWDDLFRLGLFLVVALLISALQASRERAETALDRTEQRLAAALEAARMGAWDSHMWTGEFWVSRSLAGVFGRQPGEFAPTYEAFMEYVHPDDRGRLSDEIARSLEDGTDFDVAHRITLPDGMVRHVNTRGRILYDETGKAARLIGVAAEVNDPTDPAEADTDAEPVGLARTEA